jgi:hypothetical protein
MENYYNTCKIIPPATSRSVSLMTENTGELDEEPATTKLHFVGFLNRNRKSDKFCMSLALSNMIERATTISWVLLLNSPRNK